MKFMISYDRVLTELISDGKIYFEVDIGSYDIDETAFLRNRFGDKHNFYIEDNFTYIQLMVCTKDILSLIKDFPENKINVLLNVRNKNVNTRIICECLLNSKDIEVIKE